MNDFLQTIVDQNGGKINPGQLAPLTLAYIGDTVYDLYVRTGLISRGDTRVDTFHRRASAIVRAPSQAKAARRIMDRLTDDEQAVFRRGRNAKSGHIPKNADVGEYRAATGLEAVLGYLYLSGESTRLLEVLHMAVDEGES